MIAPKAFASKRDRSLCFCNNYWKIHTVTEKIVYRVPRREKHIGSFSKVSIFYTRNENNCFCQIETVKTSRKNICAHFPSRIITVYASVIKIAKRARHGSTYRGHSIIYSQLTVFSVTYQSHRSTLECSQ